MEKAQARFVCKVKRYELALVAMMLVISQALSIPMTIDPANPVNEKQFFNLPRGARLLVAYALFNDQWEMQLLKSDKDLNTLLSEGWLVARPSKIHGTCDCEFPDEVWTALEQIEDTIFASVTEEDIERYKERKSKAYPWLW